MRFSVFHIIFGLSFLLNAFPQDHIPKPKTTNQVQLGDVVRVDTRSVIIDVLVRDKNTGVPLEHLKKEDFQVFDNGRLRSITSLLRPSEKSKKLSVLIVFEIWPFQEGWMERIGPTIEHLVNGLETLANEDEVGVAVSRFSRWEKGCDPTKLGDRTLVPFEVVLSPTPDKNETALALRKIPQVVRDLYEAVSRNPSLSFQLSALECLVDKVKNIKTRKPRSQFAVVLVTDDMNIVRKDVKESLGEAMMSDDVTVNALETQFKWWSMQYKRELVPFAKQYKSLPFKWSEVSGHLADHLAATTGGEIVLVSSPSEYEKAIKSMLQGVTGRYSLEFLLDDDEPADGRYHMLEVRVKEVGNRSKVRKTIVKARAGYFAKATD